MKYNSEQFEFDFRKMKGILAMSKNRCIGKDGKLPWYYKEDLKWFKEFTKNIDGKKIVVMGRKTYESLPLLKDRIIYILSKTKPISGGCMITPDFSTSIHVINDKNSLPIDKEIIIAGGKSIYEKFMPQINEFYVTHVDKEYDGDTFMFPFEHLFNKQEVIKEFDFGRVIKYSR